MTTATNRFLSFTGQSGASYGLVKGDGVVDLGARYADRWQTLRNVVAENGFDWLTDKAGGLAADHALADVRYEIPLPNAEKIICVGRNYPGRNADDPVHIDVPSLFVRFPHSLVGHGQPLIVPAESEQLDYEGEVTIVIGKPGRRISEADALDHIAAITICNEGLLQDWMHKARFNVTQGKNFDSSGSQGPWIVPFSNEAQIADITLTTRVNGEVRQSDRTGRMLFSFRRLIAYISTFATLVPGDVINTGSPVGKGGSLTPPRWLRPGDVVEVEAEGIGTLNNRVAAETVSTGSEQEA